jgi:predicted RNA-binding protein YlxR (DUF448 family)
VENTDAEPGAEEAPEWDAEPGAEEAPEWDERPPRKADLTRTDIVSRETRPIAELIRFVQAPDGTVVPDLKRELPGRGVWVEATRATVEKAVARKLFARALRTAVEVPADLAERIDGLMAKQALGTFGLARKAGLVVTGFAKVEAAVARERLAGLLHAAEAGSDGVEKLAAALKRRFGGEIGIPVVRFFTGAQLDLALGRSNVIHAALLAGRASETFLERAGALARYRGIPTEMSTNDGHHATRGTTPQE